METNNKKRGILLTVWLWVMLITNVLPASYSFYAKFFKPSLLLAFPPIPDWIFYTYGLSLIISAIFTIYLFMWKRWAFFGLIIMTTILFCINFFLIGVGWVSSLMGLIPIIILYFIMRPKWSLFE